MTDPAHHISSLLFLESFNSHQSYSRWRYCSTNTIPASVSAIGMDEFPDGTPPCLTECPAILTTTFTPPTTCFDNWTPLTTLTDPISPEAGWISFTQNSTKAECVPSEYASCSSCLGKAALFGSCPSGWPAASVGIVEGLTTNYCCPP